MAEYIEREALRDEILNDPTFDNDTINYYLDVVDLQPSADVVEVVHSKWIKRNNERRCPVCGFFYLTNGMTVYNFCPMCGAKMDGERRSDE